MVCPLSIIREAPHTMSTIITATTTAAVAQDVPAKKPRTRAAKPAAETKATRAATPTEAAALTPATPPKPTGKPIPSLKCSGEQSLLKWGLGVVAGAATTRATLPVLGNILIASEDGQLKLTATNLEVAITVRLDGFTFEREGVTTLAAKLFADFVGALPSEKLTLALDRRAEAMNITCGAFEANIKGIAADQFPVVPSISTARPTFSLLARDLVDTIATVACAAATDISRPILTGVCIRLDGTRAAFAAADGFRLPERIISLSAPAAKQELVVPASALFEVAKAFKGLAEDVEVEVVVTDGQVLFHTAQIDIVVRRLDGQFPPYERIIPAACSSRIVMDTAELRKAVKLASYFAASSANILRLTIAPGADTATLTLTANAAEVGDNRGEVLGTLTKGKGGQIALNAKFLAEALECITTEQVALEIQTDKNPAVLRPVGENAPVYLHVVMPMTIRA